MKFTRNTASCVSFNITQEYGIQLAWPLVVARSFYYCHFNKSSLIIDGHSPEIPLAVDSLCSFLAGNICFSVSSEVQIATTVDRDKIPGVWERRPLALSTYFFLGPGVIPLFQCELYPDAKQQLQQIWKFQSPVISILLVLCIYLSLGFSLLLALWGGPEGEKVNAASSQQAMCRGGPQSKCLQGTYSHQ